MIKKLDGLGFAVATSLCITFAITSTVSNSILMGLSTFSVLMVVNLIVSLIRNLVSEKLQIPTYLVICAALVSIVELIFDAFLPMANVRLDIFIPLIVINCITLSGTRLYTQSLLFTLKESFVIGFAFVLLSFVVGVVRELFGTGWVFGIQLIPDNKLAHIFVLAPGALIALGFIIAGINSLKTLKK